MDEFKRLPWSIQDAGTNLEDCYNLNMTEYASTAIHDVFLNHLLEIDSIHYSRLGIETQNEMKKAPNTRDKVSVSKNFTDPRTGVEIQNYICHYNHINRTKQNIFMKYHIQVSQLNKYQQLACINAMHCLSKNFDTLSIDERADRLIYESTCQQRAIEKELFLARIREEFLSKNSNRYHFVPPAIDSFVMQIWKQRLIMLHREMDNIHYGLSTALTLSTEPMIVEAKLIHQENLGNVLTIMKPNIQCVFQSCANLFKTYQKYKSEKCIRLVRKKFMETVSIHDCDFASPLSTLSLILCDETDWQFRINVQDTASRTIYEENKRIIFEKPLPALYLSGNARYRKGAKYLLRSHFNPISKMDFNHIQKMDKCTTVASDLSKQCETKDMNHIEYKAILFDDFMKNYNQNVPKSNASRENVKFSIFEVSGTSECGNRMDNETFRVLISSKQDVYRQKTDDDLQFIHLVPKIERQPEYGCEVMTKNELLHEWCHLFFKPGTTIERVRFDYETGEIMNRQYMTLNDIESELEQHGIKRQTILNKLWSLLQTFSSFPVGAFLLQKSSKLADCIKVYEQKEQSSGTVSLSQFFKDVSFDKNHFDEVHWIPIDDKIITEFHRRNHILPCACPHKEFLKGRRVKPLPDQRENKTNKIIPMRKINVANDSALVHIRKRMQRFERKKTNSNKFVANNKQRKQAKKNEKRKAKRAAIMAETDGLAEAKQNLAFTIDQYNTLSGTDLTTEFAQPTSSQSIASRTRQRLKTVSPEVLDPLPKVQYTVRKSDRISIKPKRRINF